MEKYENIENCKTETELFELWKAKKPQSVKYQDETFFINHKNVFISDGIVNKEGWNSHNGKKILYVLKEAYSENEDWSLTKLQ